MCNAIPLAALLTALAAGLTLLRCARPGSPNADLVTEALLTLENGPSPKEFARTGSPTAPADALTDALAR
ncbi:MAG: hypothetical protein ABIK45_05400 [Pseudomonadota bacterium]